MSEIRHRVTYGVACVLLVGMSLLTAGCSGPGGSAASSPKPAPVSTVPTATVHGPYRRGEIAVVGRLQFELVSWKVWNPEAIRLSERLWSGPGVHSTTATAGHNYVDAAVRVRNLDATWSPNAQPPRLGDPYVMTGGRRFPPVDYMQTGMVKDYPAFTLVTEHELPKETSGAVLFWPVSEDAAQVVSFVLW